MQDESNENSTLLSYFQHGLCNADNKVQLLNQITMQYLEEPTFNQLRTKE